MDTEKYYKNFNMVNELDVAGEFIYNGMDAIFSLDYIGNNPSLFVALYNLSVGIERLQKIVLVLWKYNNSMDKQTFEKNLKIHNHTLLGQEIVKYTDKADCKKMGKEENKFLDLLQKFYKQARYDRFNIGGEISLEVDLISDYLSSFFKLSYDPIVNSIVLLTDDMKEFLGRVVGKISKKYYSLIKEGSNLNCIYTHELRFNSKAEKIFGMTHRKDSLISEKINEKIAFKELLIYFRNAKYHSAFLKFIDDIKELDFDPGLVNEYLEDISKGIIPQSLVDDVETLYEENNYSIKRMDLVDIIGKSNVLFDYPFINECKKILLEIVQNRTINDEIVEELENNSLYIDDEDSVETINEISAVYGKYKKNELSLDSVIKIIKENQDMFTINS